VDGFAHTVRDKDVDDECMTILKQHPKVWAGANLPGRTLTPAESQAEIAWMSDALPPSQVKRLRDQLANRVAGRGGTGGRGRGTEVDRAGLSRGLTTEARSSDDHK